MNKAPQKVELSPQIQHVSLLENCTPTPPPMKKVTNPKP